jgi:hypothetical protein
MFFSASIPQAASTPDFFFYYSLGGCDALQRFDPAG